MKNSASFIKGLRDKLNCTQDEFSRIMGVTNAALSRWENNNSKPQKQKWELIHDLNNHLRNGMEAEKLKQKLLLVANFKPDRSPVEALEEGKLEDEIEEGMDESNLFQNMALRKKQIDSLEVIDWKVNYWLELGETGEIEIIDRKRWERIMPYLMPLTRVLFFLPSYPNSLRKFPDSFQKECYRLFTLMIFQRDIKDSQLESLYFPDDRMEGYLQVFGETISVFDQLVEDCSNNPDISIGSIWGNIEDTWWWMNQGDKTMSKKSLKDVLDEIFPDVKALYEMIEIGPNETRDRFMKRDWYCFGHGDVNLV